MSIRRKKTVAAKNSPSHPTKVKGSSNSVKELSQPEPQLSSIFLEIRNELLEQQQAKKAEEPHVEDLEWEDELILKEAGILEDPNISDISTNLLNKDADIFKKFDIPWRPSYEQEIMTERSFDSDKENLQKTIKQYKQQMNYMQEINEGLMMANRRLREDLQDVNEHFQELTAVSKEAVKRKRSIDLQCTELKKIVKDLQQKNEELTKRIADMEEEQR